MKKRILFCLAVLGTTSMLFGFDSAETADSIVQKMNEASKDAKSMDMTMDMNLDGSMEIGDGTTTSSLAAKMDGSFDVVYNLDPLAMSMEGSAKVSALGTDENMNMKMFGVTNEDGKFETYTYQEDSTTGEGSWVHQLSELGDVNMQELMELTSSIDYKDWGINFELAPEGVDVDGTECYLLSTTMDAASLNTVITKTEELIGEEIASEDEINEVISLLTGIKMNIEYYVDPATYTPVKMHIDFNDSDLSSLSQYAALAMGEMGEGTTLNLLLNDFSIDATCSYGDGASIEVPQEALDAVASGEALEADSLDVEELASEEFAAEESELESEIAQ